MSQVDLLNYDPNWFLPSFSSVFTVELTFQFAISDNLYMYKEYV